MGPFLRRLLVSGRAKMPVRSVHAIHCNGFITKEAVEHDNIDAINLTSVTAAQVDDKLRAAFVTTAQRSDRYSHAKLFTRNQQNLGSLHPALVY